MFNPQGLFKKAEIGLIGTDIVLRTITDLSDVHYSRIPLQEIKWASCRALDRKEHIKKRALHFLCLGGGIGASYMIYSYATIWISEKSVPSFGLLFGLFMIMAGFLLGGAILGLLLGIMTSTANEVRLSMAAGNIETFYVEREQLIRLRALLENVGIKWKQD